MEQDISSYNKIKKVTNEELAKMWTQYFADHDNKELIDALILQYIYLTRYVVGRVKAYEAIVKGENIPEPGVPESFKVLVKELQALGLDIKLFTENNEELELKEHIEDGIDFSETEEVKGLQNGEDVVLDEDLEDGYSEEEEMIDEDEEEMFEDELNAEEDLYDEEDK